MLQTDDCTTAGRITERIVRWCSSVIIQQQYMYCRLLNVKECKIHPIADPEVQRRSKVTVLTFLRTSSGVNQ